MTLCDVKLSQNANAKKFRHIQLNLLTEYPHLSIMSSSWNFFLYSSKLFLSASSWSRSLSISSLFLSASSFRLTPEAAQSKQWELCPDGFKIVYKSLQLHLQYVHCTAHNYSYILLCARTSYSAVSGFEYRYICTIRFKLCTGNILIK